MAWGYPLDARQVAGTAMLSAVAALFEFLPLDIPFPLLPRVTIDPVGIPIAIAGILYGPTAGLASAGVAGIVIVWRGRPDSASFKVVAEAATVVPLAWVLWRFRSVHARGGRGAWTLAGLAMAAAVGSRALVMTGYNYVFFPVLLGLPEPAVVALLVPLAAFNVAQGLLNVVPAYVVVDRLPPDLKPEWFSPPPA